MKCPECDGVTTVLQTYERESGGVYRRRKCLFCGYRYSTSEEIVREISENHAEETTPDQPAVQRRTNRDKAKPYGLPELHIALRIR